MRLSTVVLVGQVKLPDAARRLSVLLAVLATVAMFPVSKVRDGV